MAWDGGGRRREASCLEPGGPGSEAALLGHHAGGWSPVVVSHPSAQEGPWLSLPRGLSQLPLKLFMSCVCQAPGYHDLRAIIEVLVTVLGEVQDGILRYCSASTPVLAVGWPPPHRSPRVQMGALIISGHQRRQGEDKVGRLPLVPLQVVGSLKLGQSSS